MGGREGGANLTHRVGQARRKGAAARAHKAAAAERDVLAKIAEMPKPDRAMAERIHAIVKASAPELSPRT